MKRIICVLTTLVLTFAMVLSLSACGKEIENGSEITRVNFEIEFYNENGEVKNATTVTAKFYTTFAPKTTAQLIELINKGYYDGVCVSNVSSTYAQFGDYKLNEKGELVPYGDAKSVDGEFYNNGLSGNRLTMKEGTLFLMHDKGQSETAYNSGKATIGVCFSSSAPFEAENYCLFGQLLSDDGDSSADKDSLERLTSTEKAKKIADALATENNTKVYYVVKDENDDAFSGYYTYFEEDDGTNSYYKGLFTEEQLKAENNPAEKLTDEEVTAFQKRVSSTDNKFEYYNLPVNKIIIKKASVVK